MKKGFIVMIAFFAAVFTMNMVAQDQGMLVMEITEVDASGDAAQMAEMMRGTQTSVHYMGKKSVVEMNMMGGMVNMKMKFDDGMDMLLDAMGQKIWVNQSQIEVDKAKANAPDMDITYDKSDTKEIMGYNCYKMNVVVDGANGEQEIEAYITEDLDIKAQVMQGVDMTQFAGFPLEYKIAAGPMTMTITTKELKGEVDASVFELNTNGYQKMTMDQLQSMTGGMGGFGF